MLHPLNLGLSIIFNSINVRSVSIHYKQGHNQQRKGNHDVTIRKEEVN